VVDGRMMSWPNGHGKPSLLRRPPNSSSRSRGGGGGGGGIARDAETKQQLHVNSMVSPWGQQQQQNNYNRGPQQGWGQSRGQGWNPCAGQVCLPPPSPEGCSIANIYDRGVLRPRGPYAPCCPTLKCFRWDGSFFSFHGMSKVKCGLKGQMSIIMDTFHRN
jgi:hypothetical protein